jgi:hypothetical protein
MKLLNKAALLVSVSGLLVTGSCKKSFFTDVNNNPNTLENVTPTLLLPTVEAAMAYTQGGDISRYSALLMQQMYGANSQSQQYYIYGLNPGTFDNLWPDYYTSTLENDYTLINISNTGSYNAYGGIARLIMAYELQVGVDLWGDLPYSQALTGNNGSSAILHPTYDKAQGLYDTVASLIDVGTALLQSPDAGSLTPSADDVIFGGNAGKWVLFGHALKARMAIHQSKGNAAMAATALTEAGMAFQNAAGNTAYFFGTKQTDANPWYQFYRDRPGDQNFTSSPFSDSLIAQNDPRYGSFDLDSTDATGNAFSYYNKINSPVELITYEELLFIQAEATLRSSGDIAAANTFYKNAITVNMQKLGVAQADIDTYLAANGTLPGSVDAAIAKVAREEFTALFLNPEAWTVWRRTGYPQLKSTSPGVSIPRRLLYPQTEINFNGENVPKNVTLYSPTIFWDN